MKLAWMCYNDDPEYPEVKIVFTEPEHYMHDRVVAIVYTEIEE